MAPKTTFQNRRQKGCGRKTLAFEHEQRVGFEFFVSSDHRLVQAVLMLIRLLVELGEELGTKA